MKRLILVAALAAGCSTTSIEGESPQEGEGFFNPHVSPSVELPIVEAEHPPPPIAGGTLAMANGVALIGDAARLRIMVVDVQDEAVKEIPVDGMPGRALIEGDLGYVLLRNRGKLLTVDLERGEVVEETDVCAAPRGLARHPDGSLRVTCFGGALLKVTADDVTTIGELGVDLRDIVIIDGTTYVSWFRSATVGEIDEEGRVRRRFVPEALERNRRLHIPAVVWRMVPTPHGKIALVHQTAAPGEVPVSQPGGYGGGGRFGCEGISGTAVSEIDPATGTVRTEQLDELVLPVDLAVKETGDGFGYFIPAAGNHRFGGIGGLIPSFRRDDFAIDENCQFGTVFDEATFESDDRLGGTLTAVAMDASMHLYAAFQREPARLRLIDFEGFIVRDIDLGGPSIADTGMTLFHRDAGAGIACASCHPEGGDDGFAWTFEGIDGVRRTQMLRGGIKGTEPFHWEGDLADFNELADEVFTHRMGGALLTQDHRRVFINYIDRMPDVKVDLPAREAESAARGKAVFERADVGCAGCHLNGDGTDNRSYNVGTGGLFQTPALRGLVQRLPLMHTGCAKTITARFDPDCGGGDAHGKTSHLSAAEIVDLTRYLETL